MFLLMVPESACIPVPSELTLLFSGYAVHQGWMSFPLAVSAATAGNLAGSLLAYGLGASHALDRLGLARRVLGRWEGLLERHGTRAVFVARLLPLARTFVSVPAGALRVRLGPFIALTTAGCAIWAIAFVLAGMLASSAWATVDSVAGRILLVLGLLALLVSLKRSPLALNDAGRPAEAGDQGGEAAAGRGGDAFAPGLALGLGQGLRADSRAPADLDPARPAGDQSHDRLTRRECLADMDERRDAFGVIHVATGVGAARQPVLDERAGPACARGADVRDPA